jgi:putative sterol carrier protein
MALKAEALFAAMAPHFATHGAAFVAKVQAVFHFEIKASATSEPKFFTIDLKNGNGSIAQGKVGEADATFIILDDDLVAIADGKLNPQVAFMQGKMKVRGNMGKASKFTPDLFAARPKL